MAPEDAASDRAAVRRCQAGDGEAFAELVLRHQDRVYGLALRLCAGEREDAADVAQEAFVRAYAALGRFRAEQPVVPWLLRIVVNLCRDRARRRRTRPETRQGDGWEDATADPSTDPETAAIMAEERRAVRTAVAALPEDQRLLIALAYDRDLALADIARLAGLPLTVVKNRLYRARRAIGARLAGEARGDGLHSGAAPAPHPGVR